MATGLARKSTFIALSALILICIWIYSPVRLEDTPLPQSFTNASKAAQLSSGDILTGHVIAPKLGNETIKADLGRAAWKVLHTTFARFPDKPTKDESEALRSYIHLFQRLYPCGECAGHFGKLLEEFPPQVSSRTAAAGWGCHVHNMVNEKLGKEIFDCSNIGDFYDCGCADGEEDAAD